MNKSEIPVTKEGLKIYIEELKKYMQSKPYKKIIETDDKTAAKFNNQLHIAEKQYNEK